MKQLFQLLCVHCVSILTYTIDVVHVADRIEPRRLRVAYNSIFHCLFDNRPWELVTELQHALRCPTWEELVNDRRSKFCERKAQSEFIYNFTLCIFHPMNGIKFRIPFSLIIPY